MNTGSLQRISFTFTAGQKYYIEASSRLNFAAYGIGINSISVEILRLNGSKLLSGIPMALYSQASSAYFNQPYRGWTYF
jgi:hypothetical protein